MTQIENKNTCKIGNATVTGVFPPCSPEEVEKSRAILASAVDSILSELAGTSVTCSIDWESGWKPD